MKSQARLTHRARRLVAASGFGIPGLACAIWALGLSPAFGAQPARGMGGITIKDQSGQDVPLYAESHALIIGISNYTNGWPSLPGVAKDIRRVQAALEQHGFTVAVRRDLTYRQMDEAFREFINKRGLNPQNRLVFYFAGHGHTVKQAYGEQMGYIVPADAPNPQRDRAGFLAKAMSMQQMEVYAKLIQAKHALFLFDSCFSGAVFALSRAVPANISYKTARPVRQFITSGSADETVSDQSVFCDQFIAALSEDGDVNGDGYVTGSELGEFLQEKVINYSRGAQHPQYGKLRHPRLDKGDCVFKLSHAGVRPVPIRVRRERPIEQPIARPIKRPVLPRSRSIWWTEKGTIRIQCDGRDVSGFAYAWSGDDAVAFDAKASRYFLLPNCRGNSDGQPRPTKVLESRTGAVWRKSLSVDGGYWLFLQGKALTGLLAEPAGDAQVSYDPKSGFYFLLAGYGRMRDSGLHEAEVFAAKSPVVWRRSPSDKDTYWVFMRGKAFPAGLSSSVSDGDLVAYEAKSKRYFLLPGYANASGGHLRPAEMTTTANGVAWRRAKTQKDNYWLFANGAPISGLLTTAVDGDRVSYDRRTGTYFLLRGYDRAGGYGLYPAEAITPPQRTVSRRSAAGKGSYWLFVNGAAVTGLRLVDRFQGYLLSYDPRTACYFLLIDPNLTEDSSLRAAKPMAPQSRALWRATRQSYWLYVNGQSLTGLTCRPVGNDLMVFDPRSRRSYVLPNHRNGQDNVVREAMILSAPGYRRDRR